jgi:hypothetical protein
MKHSRQARRFMTPRGQAQDLWNLETSSKIMTTSGQAQVFHPSRDKLHNGPLRHGRVFMTTQDRSRFMIPQRQGQDLWHLETQARKFMKTRDKWRFMTHRDKLEDLWRLKNKYSRTWQLETSSRIWHLETSSKIYLTTRDLRIYMTTRDKLAYLWHIETNSWPGMKPRDKDSDLWHLETSSKIYETRQTRRFMTTRTSSRSPITSRQLAYLWNLRDKLAYLPATSDKVKSCDTSGKVRAASNKLEFAEKHRDKLEVWHLEQALKPQRTETSRALWQETSSRIAAPRDRLRIATLQASLRSRGCFREQLAPLRRRAAVLGRAGHGDKLRKRRYSTSSKHYVPQTNYVFMTPWETQSSIYDNSRQVKVYDTSETSHVLEHSRQARIWNLETSSGMTHRDKLKYLWHLETSSRICMTPRDKLAYLWHLETSSKIYVCSRQTRVFMTLRDKLAYLWQWDKLAYTWHLEASSKIYDTSRQKI